MVLCGVLHCRDQVSTKHTLLGGDLSCGFGDVKICHQSVNQSGTSYMQFTIPEGEEHKYPDLQERILGISEVSVCPSASLRVRACLARARARGYLTRYSLASHPLASHPLASQIKIYSLMGHVICGCMSKTLDTKKGLGRVKGNVTSRLVQSKKVMNKVFESLKEQKDARAMCREDGQCISERASMRARAREGVFPNGVRQACVV